ncbi:MAG: glycosyltransferase [bacterium]
MKILFLTHLFPNRGNPIRGIFHLFAAKALIEHGHSVKVICPQGMIPPRSALLPFPSVRQLRSHISERRQTPLQDEFKGIEVIRPYWFWLPKELGWKQHVDFLHFFSGRIIRNVIRAFRPDLILSAWAHPYGTYAKYVRKAFDIPYYSIMVGSDILIEPDLHRGWDKIQHMLNTYCDLNICVSEQMLKDVRRKRNLKNLVTLRNGYDKTLYTYTTRKRRDPDSIKLVSVGDFVAVKGHDILLQAMTLLPEHFELTLRGAGALHDDYARYIRENGLERRVRILEKVQTLKRLFDESDICCMPSRSEGLPAVPLEAMACGLPVVATRVGGLNEIVKNGFNGFLCQPESPQDMADKIRRAAEEIHNHKGIADWVRREYTWDNWVRNLVKLYHQHESRRQAQSLQTV